MNKQVNNLLSLLGIYKDVLTDVDIEEVESHIYAGELSIALENLCVQIFERNGECSSQAYEEIKLLALELNVHERFWIFLKPSEISGSETGGKAEKGSE